ncbi:hypothetical protein PR003_g12756 [Phytophthora rubi]|uniref:Uncharacterized protein n=1 Tax=Phytophthora rubi TaxID=129364 RepID=A0A6A3ICH7_9STRA|nr:hypothetical protein PR002_g24990 [Phytophthora rubi]KAE8979074.1 hypothetical protein PR001_g24660 [Phytophthora rubi]KAE9335941.1 hypothetical protein PR003_g12756 [Phytophthora rubi]
MMAHGHRGVLGCRLLQSFRRDLTSWTARSVTRWWCCCRRLDFSSARRSSADASAKLLSPSHRLMRSAKRPREAQSEAIHPMVCSNAQGRNTTTTGDVTTDKIKMGP